MTAKDEHTCVCDHLIAARKRIEELELALKKANAKNSQILQKMHDMKKG